MKSIKDNHTWLLVAEAAFFLTLLVVIVCTAFQLEWKLNKTRTELRDVQILAADRLRERDRAWDLYQQDEAKLKDFQSDCAGMNCREMFSSEAAGVVSATYSMWKPEVLQVMDFCNHDERVNLGKNYPGARLASYQVLDRGNEHTNN